MRQLIALDTTKHLESEINSDWQSIKSFCLAELVSASKKIESEINTALKLGCLWE